MGRNPGRIDIPRGTDVVAFGGDGERKVDFDVEWDADGCDSVTDAGRDGGGIVVGPLLLIADSFPFDDCRLR